MVWRNERPPGWPGRMGFGRGKVVGTQPCSPRTPSLSLARAEPFPGKRPSRRQLRAVFVPLAQFTEAWQPAPHRVLPTPRGASVHCFNASTTEKCTHQLAAHRRLSTGTHFQSLLTCLQGEPGLSLSLSPLLSSLPPSFHCCQRPPCPACAIELFSA